LPAFVNSHEVSLIGQAPGAQIDAQALTEGPVLDIAGPNISIEGITIQNCPTIAILVRAVHFRLSTSVIQSCDVGSRLQTMPAIRFWSVTSSSKTAWAYASAPRGRNSVVASNEFIEDKDAGFGRCAVRRIRTTS
jgi:hypothetical protein